MDKKLNKNNIFLISITAAICSIAILPVRASVLTQQSNPSGIAVMVAGSTIAGNGSLSISSAPSTALTVVPNIFINNGNGNVGIKTAAPTTTLDVNGILNTSGASNFIGAATFQSSITVLSATFSTPLSSFTTTSALSGDIANVSNNTCIAESTQTLALTLPANVTQVMAVFTGAASNNTPTSLMSSDIRVDGTATCGNGTYAACISATVTSTMNMSYSKVITGLSAGYHTFCVSFAVNSGIGTLDTNSINKLTVYMLR